MQCEEIHIDLTSHLKVYAVLNLNIENFDSGKSEAGFTFKSNLESWFINFNKTKIKV